MELINYNNKIADVQQMYNKYSYDKNLPHMSESLSRGRDWFAFSDGTVLKRNDDMNSLFSWTMYE